MQLLRFSDESTILRTRVDSDTVRLALQGKSGAAFTDDYRGVPVLSAYTFADIDHIRWAVMAEIDEEEVKRTPGGERAVLARVVSLLYALAMLSLWFVGSAEWGGGAAAAPFDADFSDLGDAGP